MRPVSRSAKLLCALAGLLVAMALAPSVSAAQTLTKDKQSPTVGDAITFTAAANECRVTYTFKVDDRPAEPPQSSNKYTTSFTTEGSHTVSVVIDYTSGSCEDGTGSITFQVEPGVSGSIAVEPDPPRVNETATLSASASGGYPGYTFAWDIDNDGAFDDATTRVVDTVFTKTGPQVVRVRIRDAATSPETNETVVTRTIDVVNPPPPPPPPAPGAEPAPTPPPAPPCVKRLAFELSEFTTDGCFRQTGTSPSARWETTRAIKLNGIPFADFGQTFTITFPTAAEPGGHFAARDSSIQLRTLTAFSGDIDWTLPAGGPGEEKVVDTFTVLAGTKLLSLNVRGSIALRLGREAGGKYYASFPLNIELPGGFRAGPNPEMGRVTGTAALRVDLDGVRYDGLRLAATNVWIGKLKVVETCFSFVPSGGQSVSPCATPTLDGRPYVTCESNANTDRWDGNAVIELPGNGGAATSGPRLAAFGGLADGQVSKLGGFADNLGTRAPIAPKVFLNRIGVGLCLTPPPLIVRGDVGIGILPTPAGTTVAINGRLVYTDEVPGSSSWKLEIGGSVSVFDRSVGEGSVTLRGYGGIDFGLTAGFNLYDIASLNGQINGWVDSSRDQFAVQGSVQACVGGKLCAKGSGAVSHIGAAGCVEIISTFNSPDLLVSFNPFRVRFATTTTVLRAGFGHRWNTSTVDLFSSSCNFGAYVPTRTFGRAAQAGGGSSLKIARGTAAVSLRVRGTDGPPKIVLRGPGGTTITSPASGGAQQVRGRYMLVENPTDGTTNVVLIRPARGTWTVNGVPGATSTPTRIDRAKVEPPATFGAKIGRTGEARTLSMVYAVPKGTSVRLV